MFSGDWIQEMVLQMVLELQQVDRSHCFYSFLLNKAQVVGDGGTPDELPSSHIPLRVDEREELDFFGEDYEEGSG